MIKYSVKNYKIMFDNADAGSGGSEEKLGFNNEKIEALKGEVDNCFNALKAKTELLDDLETIVQDCWNGPDAEDYLDSVYAKANELIKCCGDAYDKIKTTIDSANTEWTNFQNTNSITV